MEKKKKKMLPHVLLPILLLLLLASAVSMVSASVITGSIGNGRMVLRAEKNEVIEKYVLVKNVNDVSVNIEIFASGDLADYTDITDKKFTLAPGEEKEAYFTIKAKKENITETSINVKFIPPEGSSGVVLSSVVTVIVGNDSPENEPDDSSNEGTENGIAPVTGDVISPSKSKASPVLIAALSITALIFLTLVLMLFYLFKRKEKKASKLKKSVKARE